MDEARLRKILAGIEEWENRVQWLYLDTRGNVTIGIGCLIPHAQAAMALPLRNAGWDREATPDEKGRDFARVKGMRAGLFAQAYRAVPPEQTLRLTDAQVDELALNRLRAFLASIEQRFPDFESYPEPVQDCVLDLVWNLGFGKFCDDFDGPRSHFGPALRARDWATCARECHVSTSREARNAYRADCFVRAAKAT